MNPFPLTGGKTTASTTTQQQTPPPPAVVRKTSNEKSLLSHLFHNSRPSTPVGAAPSPSASTPAAAAATAAATTTSPPGATMAAAAPITSANSSTVFSFGGSAAATGARPPLNSFRKRRTSMDNTSSELLFAQNNKYFNEKECANLAKQFHAWTNKQQQTMDREAFRKSLGLLGMVQDALLCDQLFRVFNKSNTGQINFEEYCNGLGVLMKGSMEEKLDFSFNMTDMDGSGAVSFEELVLAVDSMRRIYAGVMGVQSPSLDQEKIRRVFQVIDSDGDGRIGLEEYKTAMKRNPEFLHTLRGIELFRPTPTASLLQANKRIAHLEQVLDAVLQTINKYEEDEAGEEEEDLLVTLRKLVEPAVPLSPHCRAQSKPLSSSSSAADGVADANALAAEAPPTAAAGAAAAGEWRAESSNQHLTPSPAVSDVGRRGELSSNVSLGDLVSVKSKGAVVSFGHKNWDLVINVMKGIQMAVSRGAMEADRDVSPYDYSVKEKYTLVSSLDPYLQHDSSSSNNRTRFVDYAPFVFAKLRQHFKIEHEEYMNSIGPGSMLSNLMLGSLSSLSELGSEGKSGSFFYLSSDNRYMVKTVRRDEHKWLRQILPSYYRHMTRGGDGEEESLLTRMVGCHVVRRSSGTNKSSTLAHKVYFVVMTNALITDLELDRRYDLKGSWVGRRTKLSPGADCAGKTLKDLDFRDSPKDRIFVDSEMKKRLMSALRRDVDFLEQHHIIDYSVLLGIHEHTATTPANAAVAASGADSNPSPSSSSPFTAFHGGFRSVDGKQTYLVGIIDFLTRYSKTKQVEHAFKSVAYFNNRNGISVMPARAYAKRFLDFMESTVIIDEEREAYLAANTPPAASRAPSLLRRFSL